MCSYCMVGKLLCYPACTHDDMAIAGPQKVIIAGPCNLHLQLICHFQTQSSPPSTTIAIPTKPSHPLNHHETKSNRHPNYPISVRASFGKLYLYSGIFYLNMRLKRLPRPALGLQRGLAKEGWGRKR